MGLFDTLKQMLGRAESEAKRQAARQAGRQAVGAARKAVEGLGDDFLDAAENELEEGRQARSGREPLPGLGPSATEDVLARTKAMEQQLEESARARGGAPSKVPELSPEERARAELERLKRKKG